MLFISHATADDERVNQFAAELQKAGITDLWIDHVNGIGVSDEWGQSIQKAANDCEAGVFILTPESAGSSYCEAEWTRILTLKKRLYVVLLDFVPTEHFPLRLGIIQYADLTGDKKARGLAALVKALGGKADLDAADPAVAMGGFRLTGNVDPKLNVPMQGREADVMAALKLIEEAPLFVTGIGGLGKSRLAYALVNETGARWNSAVWHRCTDLTNAENVYELLRDHYDLDAKTDPRAVLKRIAADGRLLVVVDNAESVSDGARAGYVRLIQDLQANHAAVCITTRIEWREVVPKRKHEPTQLDAETAASTVPAFADLLGIERELTSETAAALATAARRHPRLIELAVGKLDHLPADAVIAELKALKTTDMQEALTEMIRVTVGQMTAQQGDAPLKALRRLAVCRGGFTLEAAEYLTATSTNQADAPKGRPYNGARDDLNRLLRVLTDYKFVRFDGERYGIDELVSAAVGVDDGARRAQYDFYKALAQRWEEAPDHMKYVKMDAERENYDAAFEWALVADPTAAYWLANACGLYLANRGRFGQRMAWFTALERALVDSVEDRTKAALQNSLGNIYTQHPFGDRRDNLKRAVAAYEAALVYLPPDIAPMDYAAAQNNLGNAYGDLAALEDKADNLRRAVAAYEAALVYWTPYPAPMDYAAAQNNLGNAYADLAAVDDKVGNLKRAVAAYEAALVYRTPDAAPLEYAGTQNNLGTAYRDLGGVENQADNLKRAVAAYEAALVYYTADAAPLDYARTQYNLGNAYRTLAVVEDKVGNLKGAVAAYEVALVYWTADAAPLDYARTQRNLGIALEDSGDLRGAVRCWREAERYYRVMGYVGDADKVLRWIADREKRLGGDEA